MNGFQQPPQQYGGQQQGGYPQQQMQAPAGAPAQKDYGTEVIVDGRMVWGGLDLVPKRNFTTKQEEIDPKTGRKIMNVSFGLAVPKPNPQSRPEEVENFNKLWTAIHTEGGKQGFQWPNPKFAWKFDDGDGRKDDGSEYPAHYKGCIVIKCSTRLPLNIFKRNADGSFLQITHDQIKTGDYIRVNLNIKGHGAPNAGLYINPAAVAFLGYGEAIIASADPKTMFGNGPFNMPQGASATPIGGPAQMPTQQGFGQPTPQFGNPQFPQSFPQQQQAQQPWNHMQQPAVQNNFPQQQQVDPNWNVMPQQFQQQMGNAPAQSAMQQPMNAQYGSQPNPTMPGMQQPTGYQGGAVPNAFPGNGPQFPGQGGR